MGHGRGLGRVVRVLADQELGAAQRAGEPLGVGLGDDRIGRHDPNDLDGSGLQRVRQLGCRQARRRGDPGQLARDVPQLAHLGTMLRIRNRAIARKHARQASGFATAHRVRLAGERERAAAGAADVARGQAEIDERAVLERADRRLVDSHRPQRHRARRAAEAAGGGDDVSRRYPGGLGGALDGPFAGRVERVCKPIGVALGERAVDQVLVGQNAEHRCEQRKVGARPDRQVDVGCLGGRSATRIDHDQLCAGPLAGADPRPYDRVARRRVGAHDQEAVGPVDVGVCGGRAVRPEGAGVAGDCTGHAKARVGVDVVGPEESLGELRGDVVILGRQLPGDVERDRVRAVLGDSPAPNAAPAARSPDAS